MSDSNRYHTKEIAELAESLVKSFFDDQVTVKSLDTVNTFIQVKKECTIEEIKDLLDHVQAGHSTRIAQKKELLPEITSSCMQLGIAQIIEGVAKNGPAIASFIQECIKKTETETKVVKNVNKSSP